ncbi:MAG: calcineurin-like phosphoesterase family protein [Bacteroidales bacterium]|jgi:3',5'-cyclic AMP phosphodiesterase CpdA|nr:calcineurin-like phosphoesterase family protein [Bacteroidales bacterium]
MKSKQNSRFNTLPGVAMAFAAVIMLCTGCPQNNEPEPTDTFKITGVSLPGTLKVSIGSTYTMMGKGFQSGDYMKFVSVSDDSVSYDADVTDVTDSTVSFAVPSGIKSGSYDFYACRNSESVSLGTITVTVVVNNDIPDKEGMNVKGMVYCDGVGVAGVPVSDGVEVTTTDEDGIYYLSSDKKYGYVFITIPKDYEVNEVASIPQFFDYLQYGTSVCEECDFELFKTDNSKYMLIAMPDMHLANRNNDLSQFQTGFLNEVSAKIASRDMNGEKTYLLTLGDETWDIYWYSNNYQLPDWINTVSSVGAPVFNIMGNHDNDPYCADDFEASAPFREDVGPSYYSFNLGDFHYVVLDDIVYINTGGSFGTIGNRSYAGTVTDDQMDWLAKDLALVKDKSTPLIVAMHIPLHNNPTEISGGEQVNSLHITNARALLELTNQFSNVQYLTGHTHINFYVDATSSDAAAVTNNTIERNIAAVCATWWWTGKLVGDHICRDGSPGGYGVFEMDGKNYKYHYKGMECDDDYQFRTYDRNTIDLTTDKYVPSASEDYKDAFASYVSDYGSPSSANEVIINVFNWEKGSSLKVTENGKELVVTRFAGKDPLHIISYEAPRLNAGATPTSSFVTCTTAHLFKCTASSATSTLVITLTQPDGDVFTQTMERPKDFSVSMQ